MIVCQCAVVNDRQIAAAIDDGARTVTQVCMSTSAARDCGGCISTVRALLCEHAAAPAAFMEVVRAAG